MIREFQQRVGFGLIVFAVAGIVLTNWGYQLTLPKPLDAFPHGIVRVAVDPSYPPFAAYSSDDNLVGIDIDLARALADELGRPVSIEPMGIDALYDALESDRVDLVISALRVEPHRLGRVRYTQAYFDAGLVLVSPGDAPVETIPDISGGRLALEFGSGADGETRQWQRRIPPFETLPYEQPEIALDSVRLGHADAALVDAISARLYQNQHPGWQSETYHVTSDGFVIAVHITRSETLEATITALESLLEIGIVTEILERWL